MALMLTSPPKIMQLRPYQSQAVNEAFAALVASDEPVLFEMSVGGGKSICAGTVCKRMQDLGKHVLCLVNSAELVRNNALAFESLGGEPSIFCASLNKKQHHTSVIFATPQSVIAAIKRNHPISHRLFNLILVDEAHGISYKNERSTFMRILRHYKHLYPSMRLLGLTGTPFRLDGGSSESIVGEYALFKKSVANITTSWLIENQYLAKPEFGVRPKDSIDMSDYHHQKSAAAKQHALESIVSKNKRLTYNILQEVQAIMANRNGAFIFCSTIPHCHEAMAALPSGQARMIIGDTSDRERHEILTAARNKEIKYLVSVSCLLVGVDVPYFCTTVFLRPTSSLTLFMQAIGRCLRLHPDKSTALVLDYAKNLDRFRDIDDPVINDAVQPKPGEEKDLIFECPQCKTMNSEFARRCSGFANRKRCDFYFEFKDCVHCQKQNDIAARICVHCKGELIDPNTRLTFAQSNLPIHCVVMKAQFWVVNNTSKLGFNAVYHLLNPDGSRTAVTESYLLQTEHHRNIFYGKFVREGVKNASKHYPNLLRRWHLEAMVTDVKVPHRVTISKSGAHYKLLKKHFHDAF